MAELTPPGSRELSPERAERLRVQLERCRERAALLAETLEREAEYLGERRLDGYHELVQRKSEQIEALERSERRLQRRLEEMGFPQGREGARAILRIAPPALREAWEGLEASLRTLQARNEANGRLIFRSLDHTQRLLELVANSHQAAAEQTYGTDGAYTPRSRSRPITQA
ncbi:flagella synthesis protein FlgN [Halorhodospira neutriphila]|uniref:FlgN family protein n=1 Tax=Halorhodospira neutriphila TaxID=168379 RepID=A0ABS1E5C1_9GAMM|nr:flagellar protein FlgN [Halorhodospira neutriphila]MBK1726930.1 hypothetical protein [Halorhodospira neutriphila]